MNSSKSSLAFSYELTARIDGANTTRAVDTSCPLVEASLCAGYPARATGQALGNEAAALALLERIPLEHVGRGLELRLLRGELRARHDCRTAILDFDRVLGAHPSRSLDERALYGRATCRRSVGELAGASADFGAYLARYPDGRFAATVRGLSR